MIVLSTSGLSFSVGERDILKNVSFSVCEGDRLGIIGVNGAGKTTLFRLICGDITPTSGEVFVAKGCNIGLLAQDTAETGVRDDTPLLESMYTTFSRLLTLEEEIADTERALAEADTSDTALIARLSAALDSAHREYYDGGGLEFRARCRGMLIRMGFHESELALPLSSLSGGQHTRLALARLLCSEPDILMLDEPTNHLDIEALDWLEGFLASYKKTVLLISHDRYFLDRVTNKTLKIERNEARLYNGNYSVAREQEESERAANERAWREQQKVIARIEANIEFQRRCGQEHNFVTIRAKEHQLSHMERIKLAPPPPREIRMAFNSDIPGGSEVVTAKHLSFSFGAKPLIDDLSFLIKRGERVLFLGANGCGKSTLMRLILGELSPIGGKLSLGYNIKIGYYDQENRTLHDEKSVMEELHDAYPDRTNGEIRSVLALFRFGADDISKSVAKLSGGERARLTLAKMMMMRVNLLILDEPTNHLDIGSREALENALDAYEGTVIAVSHDRYFIDRVATRIIELDRTSAGGMNDYRFDVVHDGIYADFLAERERRAHLVASDSAQTAKDESVSASKQSYEEKKREAAAKRSAERALERARARAAEAEAEIAQIDKELYGEAASDYVRAAELSERKEKLEEELLELYEKLM